MKKIKGLILGFWHWLKPYFTWKMLPIVLILWLATNGIWYFMAFAPHIPLWLSGFAKGYLVFLYTPFAVEKIVIIWLATRVYKFIYREDFKKKQLDEG